ncbi:MAG: hypothetical protein EP319_11640 [Deltaproteobacteria bacterium]|nr:MAG: hypothetical protein EP319_11640 [Deltaproteobacteria bacterium]
MNLKKLNVVLFTLFMVIGSAFAAKGEWTKIKHAEIFFKTPDGWNGYKEMLGIPFILVSPMKQISRITISVSPIKEKNSILTFDENGADPNTPFKKNKETYLKSIHAKMQEFYPHKIIDWDNVKKVQTIGFKYFHGGNHFIERTYILACNKQIFHMKSKYRYEEFPDGDAIVEEIVKTFNCR